MVPEVVQVLKLLVPALGMVTPYRFTTPLSAFPIYQVSIVKVVVSDGGPIITKRVFRQSHALVANAVRALVQVHEKRKGVWVML